LDSGFGLNLWLAYKLMSTGIDIWKPMMVPAIAILLLSFGIGILWLVLGVILAGQSGWQTSTLPVASA
jgi:hypothetical protein